MTLFRQLGIFITVLLILLFIGTWLANLNGTRVFLIDQLASHAQDTATSLGLSLSTPMAEQDMATVETQLNAVFDRGYYSQILLLDLNAKPLIERQLEVQIEGVPPWFVQFVPLAMPSGEAVVMSGWRQAGTLIVQSHPGYAYKELWQTALRMLIWFATAALMLALLGGLALRYLLRPLVRVERQAEAICRQEYQLQDKLPRTRELRRVVEAMNRMTLKVKGLFEEQAGVAERLQHQAFRDAVTGLGNRRYFESHLRGLLTEQAEPIKGALLLVQLQHLKKVNEEGGLEAGDVLLQRTAEIIEQATMDHGSRILARLTGGDFGILLPDFSIDEAENLAQALSDYLLHIYNLEDPDYGQFAAIGLAVYQEKANPGELLAAADTALASAKSGQPVSWRRFQKEEKDGQPALGRQQWRDLLNNALEQRQLTLHLQPVAAANDVDITIEKEVLARLPRPDGVLWPAATFMPMAERLGLSGDLDQLVLEKVFAAYPMDGAVQRIAINLSTDSLCDEVFLEWLLNQLRALPADGPRLVFEFAEFNAVAEIELLRAFRKRVKETGHGIGLDHFGQSFSNFGYLQSLRPDYVKIDRAYTQDLDHGESDNRFFISSLCNLAHSLDVAVIAEAIETEEQLAIVRELNIDGVQGYLIGRPQPMDPG